MANFINFIYKYILHAENRSAYITKVRQTFFNFLIYLKGRITLKRQVSHPLIAMVRVEPAEVRILKL